MVRGALAACTACNLLMVSVCVIRRQNIWRIRRVRVAVFHWLAVLRVMTMWLVWHVNCRWMWWVECVNVPLVNIIQLAVNYVMHPVWHAVVRQIAWLVWIIPWVLSDCVNAQSDITSTMLIVWLVHKVVLTAHHHHCVNHVHSLTSCHQECVCANLAGTMMDNVNNVTCRVQHVLMAWVVWRVCLLIWCSMCCVSVLVIGILRLACVMLVHQGAWRVTRLNVCHVCHHWR